MSDRDSAKLREPADQQIDAIKFDGGGDDVSAARTLLGGVETAVGGEEPDLAAVVRQQDVPEGGV